VGRGGRLGLLRGVVGKNSRVRKFHISIYGYTIIYPRLSGYNTRGFPYFKILFLAFLSINYPILLNVYMAKPLYNSIIIFNASLTPR